MEPRGCNRSQPVANRSRGEARKTSENRSRRLRPIADWTHGKEGVSGSSPEGLCKSADRRERLSPERRCCGPPPTRELVSEERFECRIVAHRSLLSRRVDGRCTLHCCRPVDVDLQRAPTVRPWPVACVTAAAQRGG